LTDLIISIIVFVQNVFIMVFIMATTSLRKQQGNAILSMLGALCVLGFLVWIIMSGDPNERIRRACVPTIWMGKVAVAIADLAGGSKVGQTAAAFDEFNYSCRYLVWRTFYYDSYMANRAREEDSEPSQDSSRQ
jgi:hypothetical protein